MPLFFARKKPSKPESFDGIDRYSPLLPICPVDHVSQACFDFLWILIPVVVLTRENIPKPVARDLLVTRQIGPTVTFVSPILPTHAVLSGFLLEILKPFVGYFRVLEPS
jgi:hypothetical protein